MIRIWSVIASAVVIAGCTSHGGGGGMAATARASAAPRPCTYERNPDPVLTEQSLRRGVLSLEGGDVEWGEDSYICGTARDASPDHLGEVALLVGDLDRGRAFNQTLARLVRNLTTAAAASRRVGCVYITSPANLRRLATRPNLDRVILLGRGVGGDLLTPFTHAAVAPEQLVPLRAEGIRTVVTFATQLRPKLKAWRHVFNHSGEAAFDLTSDAETPAHALTQIEDLFEDVWTCKL